MLNVQPYQDIQLIYPTYSPDAGAACKFSSAFTYISISRGTNNRPPRTQGVYRYVLGFRSGTQGAGLFVCPFRPYPTDMNCTEPVFFCSDLCARVRDS